LDLPAICFFHAGYSALDGSSVTLRANYEPGSIVFYGPKLPLDAGAYSIELVFNSPAPTGIVLGQFNIRNRGDETGKWTPVISGAKAAAVFEQNDNRPFFLAFEFFRAGDVMIERVVLKRIQ